LTPRFIEKGFQVMELLTLFGKWFF